MYLCMYVSIYIYTYIYIYIYVCIVHQGSHLVAIAVPLGIVAVVEELPRLLHSLL